MTFVPHTQPQLKALRVTEGKRYSIEYLNKDYFNGEETVETAIGTAVESDEGIFFVVTDPYGMAKMVLQAKVVGHAQ